MLNPTPWYKSANFVSSAITIVSTLVVLFPKAGAALGLTSPDAINTTVNAFAEVITLVAGAIAAITRKTSAVQPLTLTQASADAQITPSSQASQEIHDENVVAAKTGAPLIVPVPKSST